ncbi:unnamed protein product [Symbiodinium sp. CCMP2456]|nr:unnamed protein product [Symbiodinium sp. CCMP2456]
MLLEAYLETKRAADLSKRINGPHHPDTLRLQRAAELQKRAGNIQEELLKMIGEPAVLSGEVVTYKGRILHEDGCECIVSFRGKYAEAWNECTRAHQHHMSVACVFLPDKKAGFGLHAPDPDAEGKCFCPRLYGARSKEVFGYKDDEAAFLENNGLPIWGCEWFRQWCKNVEFAVARKQKLVAYFFEGQTGKGIIKWDDLCKDDANPWDGVGLGGSQKGEIAYLQKMGIDVEFRDVKEDFIHRFLPQAR